MSVNALINAYQVAERGDNPSAMTGAVKELNAMHGYNEPSKLDITNSDGSIGPTRIELVAPNVDSES